MSFNNNLEPLKCSKKYIESWLSWPESNIITESDFQILRIYISGLCVSVQVKPFGFIILISIN